MNSTSTGGGSGKNILYTIRNTIVSGFLALPLLLAGLVGFLAIGLGNLGLFVLFIGQAIIVPITVALLQMITNKVAGGDYSTYHVPASSVGQLIPHAPKLDAFLNVSPSYWLTHVWFFLSYLLANAVSVYQIKADPKATPALVAARKSRASLLIASSLIIAAALTFLRYKFDRTETPMGTMISIAAGFGLGYGWYQFAAYCGARHADIFGMAQQILSSSAKEKPPMTCIYAAKP